MAKALVIAEKPSLGRSIVSAISWWKNDDGPAAVLSGRLEFPL